MAKDVIGAFNLILFVLRTKCERREQILAPIIAFQAIIGAIVNMVTM